MINDILVHGKTQERHNQRFNKVLHCLQDAGVTSNIEKC